MTENEALKIFEDEVVILDCWIENDKDIIANCDTEDDEFDDDKELAELSLKDYSERKELFETAISALKEIQQYREIGTVEEIKDLLATISEAAEEVDESGISVGFVKDLIQLKKYREIGTVEECREAVEKQKAKKPKDSLKINPVHDGNGAYVDADTTVYLFCPTCGELVGLEENCDNYCRECGQKINKETEEE